MPHDKNGELLAAGDKVTICATVKSVQAGDEYCNLSLETDEVMFPGKDKTGITLNAKQVEKCCGDSADGVKTMAARSGLSDSFLDELETECFRPAAGTVGAVAERPKGFLKQIADGLRKGVGAGKTGLGILDVIKWLPTIIALVNQIGPMVQEIVRIVREAIGKGQTPETFVMPGTA